MAPSGGVAGAESGNLSIMLGGEDSGRRESNAGPPEGRFDHRALRRAGVGRNCRSRQPGRCRWRGGCDLSNRWPSRPTPAAWTGPGSSQCLGGGLAASEVLKQKQDRWLNADFSGGGSAENQLKDLGLPQRPRPREAWNFPSLVLKEIFERMVSEGRGKLDHSAVELTIADASRLRRIPK